MARTRLRLRTKAARLSNHPAIRDTAELENLCQELRNRVEGLEIDGGASLEDK